MAKPPSVPRMAQKRSGWAEAQVMVPSARMIWASSRLEASETQPYSCESQLKPEQRVEPPTPMAGVRAATTMART